MHVFKSKIDNWVLVCLLLSVSACLMGASVAFTVGGTANNVFAAIVLIAGAGFPVWIYISTQYIVSGDELKIISEPLFMENSHSIDHIHTGNAKRGNKPGIVV